MNSEYPFKISTLEYKYDAMEPYIDEETMILHHDKHLKAYIDNLNKVLQNYPKYHDKSLEELLEELMFLPYNIREKVRNYAGGVYNHNLYFSQLNSRENGVKMPQDILKNKIDMKYGNFENFYNILTQTALEVFGSGYAWLAVDCKCDLVIVKTQNQNSILEKNLYPLMLIDVWEHAYYLKYKNRREEYIDNFKNVINCDFVQKRLEDFLNYKKN